jgi:uncharacterized repeat protein (TIGR01451 family)
MHQLVSKSFMVEPQISIWTYFGVLSSHSSVFQKEYVKNVLHNQPAPGRSFWPNYLKQIDGFLSYMANRPEEKEHVMDHAIFSYAQSAGISAEQLDSLRNHLKGSSAEQKKDFIDNLLKGDGKKKTKTYEGSPTEKKEIKTEKGIQGAKSKYEITHPEIPTDKGKGIQGAQETYTISHPEISTSPLEQPYMGKGTGKAATEKVTKPLAAGLEVFQAPEEPNLSHDRSILTHKRRLTPERRQQIAENIRNAQTEAEIAFTRATPRISGIVGDFARTAQRSILGPSPRRILVTSQPVQIQQMTSRGPVTSTVNVLKTAARVRDTYNNARLGAQIVGKGAELAGQAAMAIGRTVAANPISLVVIGVIVALFVLLILLTGTDSFNLEKNTALCGLPDTTCGKTPPEQVELQNVISLLKQGPAQVDQGQNIGYNLTATYTGAGTADITVSDTVPAGTTYVSYDAAPTNVESTVTFDGNTVTWTLNNVPENTPQLFFFTVRAPDQEIWIQNTATARVINTSLLFQGENTAPTHDDCNGKWASSPYFRSNPLGNFGDPNCDFSLDALHQLLVQLDQINADYWYYTLIKCESGYDPNAFLRASTSGLGAYGLFQMNPQPPSTPPDVGNVIWQLQVQNAVAEEQLLASRGIAWHYWACARARW